MQLLLEVSEKLFEKTRLNLEEKQKYCARLKNTWLFYFELVNLKDSSFSERLLQISTDYKGNYQVFCPNDYYVIDLNNWTINNWVVVGY